MFTAAGEQVRFRTRKHFALLIRLALDPGKQFTRDYLADLLWPDAAPKLANHSLAQGLSVIKAKIARDAVVIQRATVGLAAGWVDVDTRHLGNGDARIDGPFLDSFEISGARPFEEWKDEYRARLIPQLRDCLVRQMDAARRIGDFATVEQRALRLRDLDPLAEESIRGVMEARAWASDRSGALKAFARYEEQLAEELDAKPSADLIRMADLLRDGRRSPPRPVVGGAPLERVDRRFEPETLIGREREFSVLYDAWLEARRKSPRIVVVTSDPGVGKTTLVNAFAASCQMDGAVVARAQAYDAERELPFAVLGELVKQLAVQRAIGGADPEALSELTRISGEILRIFPGVPTPPEWTPELIPLRIADAFLKAIIAAAELSPVLVVLDDVHAADNASSAILHVIARKLSDARVLLILTGRTSELRLSGAPGALTGDTSIGSMRSLDLEVLQPESSSELVERLVGRDKTLEPPTSRILKASGGNPLAIELLAREWAAHGSSSLLNDLEAMNTQPAPTIGIPQAIGVVFERQSRRLEEKTRTVLDLAAVLGRRLTDLSLYQAVEIQSGTAAECLSRLKDDGFLRVVGGDLEFRNELIRAQAYYAVAAPVRMHLHRRVAEFLEQRAVDEDPGLNLEIAWHYLRGRCAERAVPFAHRGAEAFLAVGAPHEAEDVLNALESVSSDLVNRRRTCLLLARALVDQSKAQVAFPIITLLLDDANLTAREYAEVAMLRASAEFTLNREPGAKYCQTAKAALEAAKQTGDPHLVAQALFECARAGSEEGLTDLVQAAEVGIESLSKHADVDSMPMAILTRAFCRFSLWDPAGSLIHLKHVESLGLRKANAAHLAFIYSGIGIANHFLCQLDEAYDAFLRAISLARKVGDDARISQIAANLCTVQMNRGRYDEAISYGEIAVRLGKASGSSMLLTAYTNLMDPLILTGNDQAAAECLESARKWLSPERRWKLRCAFFVEAASFALVQRNRGLAIDLINQLEGVARGREDAVPMPGPYWKLKAFRSGITGNTQEAWRIIDQFSKHWRRSCPFHYLDILAVRTWLENLEEGRISEETELEQLLFDATGAIGRRALLLAQGFLEKPRSSIPENLPSTSFRDF